MKSIGVLAFLCVLFIGNSFSATHVFWYKALQNGYNLSENPGPNLNVLPENVHEELVSAQSSIGGITINTLYLGKNNGPWLANIAPLELNYIRGTITSAKFRMEWSDFRTYISPVLSN